MKDTAIIYNGSEDFFLSLKKQGVSVYRPYNTKNIFKRLLFRVLRKTSLSKMFYKINKNTIKEKTIIIFDTTITKRFLEYISELYKSHRIIFWYWNPTKKTLNPKEIPNNIEKWSYSKIDCENYSLKRNTTFHFFDSLSASEVNVTKYDLFFIGKDKSRYNDLVKMKLFFKSNNLKVKMIITPNSRKHKKREHHSSPISYSEVIKISKISRVILDYYENPKTGISIRPLEAAFFNKKLITNNMELKNEVLFDEKSMFVFDNLTDGNDLLEFIKNDIKIERNKNLNYYNFKNWLNRFFE